MSKNYLFDLENPIVKIAMDNYFQQGIRALNTTFNIEKSVVPVYFPLRSFSKAEQIGSGVIVELKGEYFIFSASHVFDDIKEYQLLIGLGNGEKLLSLVGDRFSSLRGPSNTHIDDPIDASVFHIRSEVPNSLKSKALTKENLALNKFDANDSMYVICGFKTKKI